MTGVENILQRILDEAKIAADEIAEQAELSAKDIADGFESKVAYEKAQIAENARRASEDEEKRMASLASLEVRKNTLKVRQALMDEAFQKALAQLNALPREQYIEVLLKMIVPQIKTGKEEIVLSADKDTGELFATKLRALLITKGNFKPKVSFEALGDGGFLLKEGDIAINCTFSALLKEQREALELPVAQTLFS